MKPMSPAPIYSNTSAINVPTTSSFRENGYIYNQDHHTQEQISNGSTNNTQRQSGNAETLPQNGHNNHIPMYATTKQEQQQHNNNHNENMFIQPLQMI